MSSWWSQSGDEPPNDWPAEARKQALDSAATQEAADIVQGAAPAVDRSLARDRAIGTVVLAETLLPALDADQLEQLLEQLDADKRRTVPSLLHRAGWILGDDGRLHPRERPQ